MCGRPVGCKGLKENADGRIDCEHVSGLLTRRHVRWPRWGPRPVPNNFAALKAGTLIGFSGSSVRPIVISFSSFTPASGRKPNGMGVLLGYARVSKGDEQTNTLQAKALRAAGCRRLFEEAASGGRWDRPELHRLLDNLRDGDTVVVWKLDRLSRSLKDVLHIMERIAEAGAGFRSITENIDTTTPAGRMMMQMVGAFAEFERAMIRERTSAGLAAARAEGRIGGRRKKLDPTKRREIAESVITGRKSGAEMARLYNISQPTVSRIVAQHRPVNGP
jgi:DNA invertase Pin-like site-specific DNA recombinase